MVSSWLGRFRQILAGLVCSTNKSNWVRLERNELNIMIICRSHPIWQGIGFAYSGVQRMGELMNSTRTPCRHNPEPRAKKYACLPERGRLHATAARLKIGVPSWPRIPNFFTKPMSCAITFVYVWICHHAFLTGNSSDYWRPLPHQMLSFLFNVYISKGLWQRWLLV